MGPVENVSLDWPSDVPLDNGLVEASSEQERDDQVQDVDQTSFEDSEALMCIFGS